MKKYIIMGIMMCFLAVNVSITAFAEENSDMKIQKKVLQQQKEINITQYCMSKQLKQKRIAPEDYIPVLMYHHFENGETYKSIAAGRIYYHFFE